MNKIILFFRSLIFSIYMILAATIYSFFCILAFPLPFRFRYKMIVAWTGSVLWVLKKVCRIDYQIEGLENIPKDRNGIVLSKHQSTWETFFLQGLFPEAAIILKRELLWIPFFGWGLAIIEPISINRSSITAIKQIIQKGRKCLESGRWILVYPEGTRIPPGQTGIYRMGGAKLAEQTGYPVIPVAHNAGRFWPRRSFIKYPGTIKVVIGPLIETKGLSADQILNQAKNWIETTMLRLDKSSFN